MYYLRQAVGFLLQLAPCFILCLAAFEKESYRIRFSRAAAIGGTLLSIMAAAFAVIMGTQRDSMSNTTLYSNILMASAWVICFGLYMWFIQGSLVKKITSLGISITYGVSIFFLTNISLSLFNRHRDIIDIYDSVTIFHYSLFTVLSYPFLFVFVRKVISPYLLGTTERELHKNIGVLAIVIGIYLVNAAYVANQPHVVENLDIRALQVINFIFSTACLWMVYYFIFWKKRQIQIHNELQHLMNLQHLQYEKTINDIELTKRMRHDMKHQYHSLGIMLEQGNYELAKKMVLDGKELLQRKENKQFCKEPAVNALLQYYEEEMEQKQIAFHFGIKLDTLPIPYMDMVILLGNMLENAMHACQELEDGSINLHMGTVNNMLVIEMDNSCEEITGTYKGKEDAKDWNPPEAFSSSKENGGIGMRSMKQIVKENGGVLECKVTGSRFWTRAILNWD